MNSYLSILNTKTEILRVTFFTFRPKYDNYSETRSFKKFSFINLVRYESSNEYFTRNADSLTFKKSGVYYFYYVNFNFNFTLFSTSFFLFTIMLA